MSLLYISFVYADKKKKKEEIGIQKEQVTIKAS